MTDIKIKRLVLENFKCHKSLKLDFEGGNASVYGDNASGKTSIYDALTWLLFGKDSQGNGEKNIEIKPLDANGEVKDHLAVTAVEAVLDVNGEEMTLRRTYKEVWTTKRGSSQATYDGNTSEYYVSGVPCKRNAFQDAVSKLVDEDTFRMLTSVSYFANGISWQDRRAVLFRVAGIMDDAQILVTDERFKPLVESMGKLSLEDYKKKLLSEKRKFVGAKTEIPARISECQKTIEDIEGLDFAAARTEVDFLTKKKESIATQIAAIDNDSAAGRKRMEIREAELDLRTLESENKAYRASQTTGGTDVKQLGILLTTMQSQLAIKKRSLDSESSYITKMESQIAASRNEWIRVNGETFTGGNCPTCGQNLPEKQIQAAKDQFDAEKSKRLTVILDTANTAKSAKAMAEERFTKAQEEIMETEAKLVQIREQIAAAEAAVVEPKDMEDYAKPAIVPADGETDIVCVRCDEYGSLTDSGTYLKIKAKRSYSPVVSDGMQRNFCRIQYRCNGGSWNTILAGDDSGDEVDIIISNVVTSTTTAYTIEVGVVDSLGYEASALIIVPSDQVEFHLREGGDGAAFGEYSQEPKVLSVAESWTLKVKGKAQVGGFDVVTKGNLMDMIYPVGSIYMSINEVSPAVFIGGTWEQIQDRFLLAVGSKYKAGATGGESEHTLTSAESGVAKHNHGATKESADFYIRHGHNVNTDTVLAGKNTTVEEGVGETWGTGFTTSAYSHKLDKLTVSGGVTVGEAEANATAAHNNMPPYLAVYIWKRTA